MKPVFTLLLFLLAGMSHGQQVSEFIKKGDAFFAQRNFEAAIAQYTAAIEVENNNIIVLNKRGNTLNWIKQYDRAILDFNTVLNIDSVNAYAYANRGISHRNKKMLDEAISDLSKALQINPKYAGAYNFRGQAYKDQQAYEAAIADFTQLLELEPGNYSGVLNRGTCFYQLKDYEAALQDFSKAITLNAEPSDAYAWRGYTHAKMNDLKQAISDYTAAIALVPNGSNYYNNRGLYYNMLGYYQQSVNDFKKSLSLNPNNGGYYISIIAPLVRLGKLQEAYSYYETYRQKNLTSYLNGTSYKFLMAYIQALALAKDEQYEQASEALAKASDLYGNEVKEETQRWYVDMMFLEGWMLEKQGFLEEATVMYEQSLAINPYQPDLEERLKRLGEASTAATNTDKLAPAISLVNPSTTQVEINNENGSLQLIGRAKDASAIAYVKVNGVAVDKLETDGLFITQLQLKPGDNAVTIAAADINGNEATSNFVLKATAAQTRGAAVIVGKGDGKTNIVFDASPNYYAILIAAQQYEDPNIPSLQNPRRDALELGRILSSSYQFLPEHIDTLFNRSREDIMAAIVKRSSVLKENDNLLIFYAGHGYAEKDKFGDVDGYWIPTSARKDLTASYISTEDINKAIKRSNAKHILVIADACFSGAMTRALPPDAAKEINRQYLSASRKVMASGNLEPVPDNSKFIFYLKKRLEDNKEKYLTAKDLFDGFYKAVLSNSDNVPQYAAIKNVGDEGGEFVFIKNQ